MAKSLPVLIEENWETYVYHSDESPVFVSFYAGAEELPREMYPYCARVILPIAEPNEHGGPGNEEAEILWGLEDQLIETLTQEDVKCLFVARLTHGGSRELVFQLADWETFRPPVGAWIEETSNYDIDVSEHEGWEFFDEIVWPTDDHWMLIHNRQVVDNLIEAGSNPEKEHALEFVFYGSEETLAQVKQKLAERGYRDSDESTTEQLVMIKMLPLDLDLIDDESIENNRLSEELDVEFDGWGAAIVS